MLLRLNVAFWSTPFATVELLWMICRIQLPLTGPVVKFRLLLFNGKYVAFAGITAKGDKELIDVTPGCVGVATKVVFVYVAAAPVVPMPPRPEVSTILVPPGEISAIVSALGLG